MNLEWEDFDFVRRAIVARPKSFWKPKGNDEQLIPMYDAVFFALFSREKKSRWVFYDKNGEKLKIHFLWARFSRQLTRLGIQNVNLHTWRHTFASYPMMRTGNIRAVQMLLGAKSIKTTEVYSHLADSYLQAVVNMLPSPDLGTNLETTAVLPDKRIVGVLNEIRNATKALFLYINSSYPPRPIKGDQRDAFRIEGVWTIRDLNLRLLPRVGSSAKS